MNQPNTSLQNRTPLLTVLAMFAFAANSLLCRQALGEGLIDAATFTNLRTISGALVLLLIMLPAWRRRGRAPLNQWSVVTLFSYMVFFSFAYRSLGAATGALILFGAVQLTMFGAALRSGERYNAVAWIGLSIAFAGLVYLVLPGVTAPDLPGALLMIIAGISWGFYSLLGRYAPNPLEATANNFVFSLPLAVLVNLAFLGDFHITTGGATQANASGAIASGLGYVAWYAALRGLSASRAATVQLSVPAIAAFGAVLFLSEAITLRLLVSSAATLGGIALVLAQRARQKSEH
jgi:drug/metabolite transporter (DMT)-like permease